MTRMGFWSTRDAHLRCSDAEREHVAEFLRDRAAEGRLTTDELAERTEAAYRAVTMGDLHDLVADLPGAPLRASRQWRRPPARPALMAGGAMALVAVLIPGALWALWLTAIALTVVFAVTVVALGLALGPFVLAGVAAVVALRRASGRAALRPPRGPRWPASG